MKKHLALWAVMIAATLFLFGCASTPASRMYILNPVASPTASSVENLPEIVIQSVSIPRYLQSPLLITQAGKNEIKTSEFHRWAGPLDRNIEEVLIQNLSALLSTDRVKERGLGRMDDTYQVAVRIDNMTGVLGQTASLQAHWSVSGPEKGKSVAVKTFKKEQALQSADYSEYARAQSELLGTLSQEIATEIQKDSKK